MVPSTNLFFIDSHHHHHESGSPTYCWFGNLTTSSLACHINRRIPSCSIHFTSRILNHGSPLHNVQFVNYDAPVSKMSLDSTCIFMYMIQGHKREITDLVFENYKHVKKCIFRTLAQAGINIYVQWDTKAQILRRSVARKNEHWRISNVKLEICPLHVFIWPTVNNWQLFGICPLSISFVRNTIMCCEEGDI